MKSIDNARQFWQHHQNVYRMNFKNLYTFPSIDSLFLSFASFLWKLFGIQNRNNNKIKTNSKSMGKKTRSHTTKRSGELTSFLNSTKLIECWNFVVLFERNVTISPYCIREPNAPISVDTTVCLCVALSSCCCVCAMCAGVCLMPQFEFSFMLSLSCDINQSELVCMRTNLLVLVYYMCMYVRKRWVWRTDCSPHTLTHQQHSSTILRIYEKKKKKTRSCRSNSKHYK